MNKKTNLIKPKKSQKYSHNTPQQNNIKNKTDLKPSKKNPKNPAKDDPDF
ncbi:MAG TPA: hypothetical protein VHM20_02970 [Gammaproteobacteria bacterium]|jgi:hypothetical protein|nr:hypothetical protein [Gammaproteobacteria bacterium]